MVRSFLWNGRKPYGTGTSRERHDHARRQSSNTAIAGFVLDAEPGAWDQRQDGGEMAEAGDGQVLEDRAECPSLHDLDPYGGGSGRRIPASHITAARPLGRGRDRRRSALRIC